MISVPVGTGDIPCGYDICFAGDIRFAYDGNGYYIIFAGANISYGNAVYHISSAIYP